MANLGPIGISNVGFFWAPTRLEANATDANIANPPSGPGTPVIVTIDDPLPQQRFNYVAAITAVAVAAAAADFVPTPASAARASVISAAWAPTVPAPQRPNENTAAYAGPAAPQADNPPGAGVPRIVTVPDDPLPTLGRIKLVQDGAVAAPAAVPFTRHFEVLGAWEPIRFSLPAPVKIAALIPAPDIQPPPPRHMEVILAAWAAPPPAIILLPKEAAIIPSPVVADVPPPVLRHPESIFAAWAPADPPIQLAEKTAAVMPAAVPDVPPPLPRRMDVVLAAWVAAPPPIVLPPKEAALIPAPAAVADVPPPFRRSQDWTPWDVAVPVSLVVSSAATAVSAAAPVQSDNPPANQRRTPDWAHWHDTVAVKLVVSRAATDGIAVAPPPQPDNPPFGLHRFITWAWGPLVGYPGGGGEFVPQEVVASDTAPTTREWLDIVVRAWSPADPLPTLRVKQTPPSSVTAVPTVDNPSGRGVPRVITVPDDPLPQVNRKLPQAQVAAVPDIPPFSQRRTQDWTHFYPAPPLPTLPDKLIQPQIAPQADNPPFNQRRTQDWTHFYPPPPLPTLSEKLLQPGAQNDPPPFNQRRTQDYIHFKPLDPLPTLRVKLPQDQVPATHDNPPFTQRHTQLWVHWYPPYPQPDPLPTLGRKKQTPPSTDTPVIIPPVIGRPYPIGGDWWHRHHPRKAETDRRCRFVTIDGVLTWICDRLDYERAPEARLQALALVYDAEGVLEPLLEAVRLEEATNASAAKRAAAALLIRAIHDAVIEDEDDDLLLLD